MQHILGPTLHASVANFGSIIARHGHGYVGSWSWTVSAKFRCFCHVRPGWEHHTSMGQEI